MCETLVRTYQDHNGYKTVSSEFPLLQMQGTPRHRTEMDARPPGKPQFATRPDQENPTILVRPLYHTPRNTITYSPQYVLDARNRKRQDRHAPSPVPGSQSAMPPRGPRPRVRPAPWRPVAAISRLSSATEAKAPGIAKEKVCTPLRYR